MLISVENDLDRAKETNDRLKTTQKNFIVPNVLDYVKQTSNTSELRTAVTVKLMKRVFQSVNNLPGTVHRNMIPLGDFDMKRKFGKKTASHI